MRAYDKNLLNRIARRLEDDAVEEFAKLVAAGALDTDGLDTARRKRDRVLGDARDLRDLVRLEDALRDTNMAVLPKEATGGMKDAGAKALAQHGARDVRPGADALLAEQVWAAMVAAHA